MTAPDETGLGAAIRKRRLAAGLTQELLAERAGVSARSIRVLESGQSRPLPDTVERLATALNIDAQERARWLALATPAPRRRRGEAEAASARRPRLPLPPTALVGREREVDEVRALLKRDGLRILSLVGPGGVGKTRLALQVAWTLQHDYADGATFVDLTPLSDPDLVLPTVAQALDLILDDSRSLPDVLSSHLEDRHLLLVLDNFEQVVEAAPAVAELLMRCPSVRAIPTSRVALGVRSEQVYPVQPLEVPDAKRLSTPSDLTRQPAVMLFLQQARAVDPSFALTDANADHIASVCVQLDGLPLAIELAAAQVTTLPPALLAARLARPLDVLTGGPRDAPIRQRTLRDTIAWSYALLPAASRTLFRGVSVFPGGCTLDALESVCDLPQSNVLQALRSLVAAHLVQMLPQSDGTARYGMLVTIREYGLEQLSAAHEDDAVRELHARNYCVLAEESEPHGYTAAQRTWWTRLDTEIDNLRAALAWCVGRGQAGDADAVERGLRAAGMLLPYWFNRGHLAEGLVWLGRLLSLPLAAPRTSGRAHALKAAAYLSGPTVPDAPWQSMIEESVSIFKELKDEAGLAYALGVRALFTVMVGGDAAAARSLCEASLALYARIEQDGTGDHGTQGRLACVRIFEGLASLRLGDVARGEAELARVLSEGREAGGRWQSLMATDPLVGIAWGRGDFEAARRYVEPALREAQEVGDEHSWANGLRLLGEIAWDEGDVGAARSYFEQALAVIRDAGDLECLARSFWAVGILATGASASELARQSALGTLAPPAPGVGRLTVRQAIMADLARLPA